MTKAYLLGALHDGTVRKLTYRYFAQKNRKDLEQVKMFLEELEISCGLVHNPSKRVDPDYWRFFVRAKSYQKFAQVIGSWHSIKASYLRMKI